MKRSIVANSQIFSGMRILILLFMSLVSKSTLAQLPSSGSLSIKTAAGSGRSIAQEVNGNTSGNKSLSSLSATAGKSAPHGMLEFRGYSAVVAPGSMSGYLQATDIPPGGVILTWDGDPSTGTPPFNIRIEMRVDESGTWSSPGEWLNIENISGGVSAWTLDESHGHLLAGAYYYQFRIRAENSAGVSNWLESNPVYYIM